MEIFELASAPPFEAISYTWGDDSDERLIRIDNEDMEVRKNCWFALWQMRYHQQGCDPAWLWIDSSK